MTPSSTLADNLQTAHPDLTFQVVTKAQTAFADDAEYADTLVGVVVEDVLILDPFVSSCGRFRVLPEEAHGIPESAAKLILAHNVLPAHTTSEPNR
jgi:hypothetical protein